MRAWRSELAFADSGTIVGDWACYCDCPDSLEGSTMRTVRAKRSPLRAPSSTRKQSGSSAVVRRRSPDGSVGRARPRKPDSRKRSPSPGRLPKASKREGPAEAPQIPAHIRAAQGDLSSSGRDYIRRKLGTRLGKFASSIERVSVRTEDVNGPRGGVDQLCRIKVVLRGLPSVVFESRDASLNAAVDGALSGMERTVRRALRRRRMKPLRRVA